MAWWLIAWAWASPVDDAKAANAWMASSIDGPTVVALLEEAGHLAHLTADPSGDPLVQARVDDADYVVLFYDCTEGACEALQFRAWFDAPEVTSEMMNLWNRSSRLGRAYLDSDGDPTLEHNVYLAGGVSAEHLRKQRAWFVRAVTAFRSALTGERP